MRIDLDSHATTRLDPRVLEAMRPWFERGGNTAAVQHASGRAARDAVEAAREQIAGALGCDSREIVFTSGATESNNLAIRGLVAGSGSASHVITTAAEHRSVLDPVRRLSREEFETTVVPVDSTGAVDPASLEAAVTDNTVLLSAILANNEVGTINELAAIGELARRHHVFVHSDASQAIGKIPVDLSRLPVDLLSFTAHKLHGPQGIGALFVRKGERRLPLRPLLEGGGHERGLRSGTLPVVLVVGFGEAVRLAVESMEIAAPKMRALRDRLRGRLSDLPGVHWHGAAPDRRLPNNLNAGFEGVDGEALLVRVDQLGLDVSSGAACSSANPEPSHVLRAMGVPDGLARASLRFGLSRFTTEDEVDRAAGIVSDAVTSLRSAVRT